MSRILALEGFVSGMMSTTYNEVLTKSADAKESADQETESNQEEGIRDERVDGKEANDTSVVSGEVAATQLTRSEKFHHKHCSE